MEPYSYDNPHLAAFSSPSSDEALAYRLLLISPSGLSRSQLSVDFSSAYDRVPSSHAALEDTIEQIWQQRVAANPSLFNASKFRYGGYRVFATGEEDSGFTSICLHLGLTDYKTFVGTNLSPQWDHFLDPSIEDVDRCKYTASPLGNGAVVETLDHHILLLQRSQNVGEFPGHLVFPGGHSEPQEIGISGHSFGISSSDKEHLNAEISKEMFEGINREVVEETGVPSSCLSDPLFIGISRRVVNERPTAFFYVKCILSSSEVLKLYANAEHGFESTQILSIPKENLVSAAKRMPGCHQGGAALFNIMTRFASEQQGYDRI